MEIELIIASFILGLIFGFIFGVRHGWNALKAIHQQQHEEACKEAEELLAALGTQEVMK